MAHSKDIIAVSCMTLTLVLCTSIVRAEPLKSGSRSLIYRPQLQSTPSATLEVTGTPARVDQSSVSPATPQASLRHKLVRRPTVPPLATTQPNDVLPPSLLQLDDTSSLMKQ